MYTSRPAIDHGRCTLCGRCVLICESKNLAIREKTLHVLDDCSVCGHCYAVCEAEAISFETLRPRVFKSFPYDGAYFPPGSPDPTLVAGLIGSRRSVRHYSAKVPSTDMLDDLLECASMAPSAHNEQQWEFVVVRDGTLITKLSGRLLEYYGLNRLVRRAFMRRLAGLFMGKKVERYYRDHYAGIERRVKTGAAGRDQFFHGAPVLIVVHSAMDGNSPVENAQYAAYNICLLAHAMGLGTCFIGYASYLLNMDRAWKKRLGIPAAHGVHAVLTLGYPAKAFTMAAPRKEYSVRRLG
ncbi:MAG TPA: nitroreductase family protein [Spirochaetota bacterium]|nr:nitroreductase family protein [Spirochaetota bacterium]